MLGGTNYLEVIIGNRKVLSFFLNISMLLLSFTLLGILFHSTGLMTLKDLEVFLCVLGMTSLSMINVVGSEGMGGLQTSGQEVLQVL